MIEKVTTSLICLVLFVQMQAFAQINKEHTLSLQQCADAAVNNNLQVRQSDLQMQAAAVNVSQSKSNMLPDMFGNAGHGFNQGRSIDPFTNSYINQQIIYGNYSISSAAVLFNGFQLKNLIKQNTLNYEANKMDLQQAKDNVILNVILAYLQILNNEEQLQQSIQQASVTRNQMERLNIMNQSGAISPATLYDLKGQLANDELSIVSNQTALNTAKLTLAQLMNLPYDSNLSVEKIMVDTFPVQNEKGPKSLYDIAVKHLALVKAAEYRKLSALKSVQVAKGLTYPVISLSGSFNTNYSNAANKDVFINTLEVPSGDYVNVNGSKEPVITKRTKFASQKISYGDQFNNNYNTSVFVSVQVPILNKFRAKNRIALAKIDVRNAEVVAETVKTQLSQNIEQAYFNLTAASEKYKTLQQQYSDFTESFRIAEVKFDAGAINQIDYLIAKNNVDRATANLISTRYDYIFRTKILNYYQGNLSW